MSKQDDIINIELLVNEVIEELKPLWKDNSEKNGIIITILTEFKCNFSVKGNGGELKSAIHNIIKNSIEAMPNGGKITINTFESYNNLIISISDEGIGMDEDTMIRVFQPFFTTKGFDAGRGLGMSGAYAIIKEHNGNIRIEKSSIGKGTTFEISLPIIHKVDIISEPEVNINLSFKILWVDDDENIASAAKEMLEVLGHKGDIAKCAEDAMRFAENNFYHLLITDIGMPGINGWELIKRFRSKFGDKTKIAVITGWGDQIDPSIKQKYEVDYILSKPVSISEFNALISQILNQC